MQTIEASVAGRVLSIDVKVGDRVNVDDEVVKIESMKMELPVASEVEGTVKRICVAVDEEVDEGAILIELEG